MFYLSPHIIMANARFCRDATVGNRHLFHLPSTHFFLQWLRPRRRCSTFGQIFFCRSSIFGWRQVFNPEQVPEVLFSALIMPPLIATQKVENGAPSPNSQDQQFGLLVQCRWERFLFQILKWNDEQDGHISFIMGRCLLVESWGYFEQLPVGTWHKGFPFPVCFGILFNVSNLPNVPDWWITNPNCSQNVPY